MDIGQQFSSFFHTMNQGMGALVHGTMDAAAAGGGSMSAVSSGGPTDGGSHVVGLGPMPSFGGGMNRPAPSGGMSGFISRNPFSI